MKQLLQHYLKRLTNLTGNNRSLMLLRLINDQFIDLHAFDHSLNTPSFDLIKSIIAKKKVALCAESDPRDAGSNALSLQLKKLRRTEDFIFHERGSRDLYIGWPFVEGRFNDDTLVRGPLLFFPVQLSVDKSYWQLALREDVNITFNKSFLLAYSYYNEIPADEKLLEASLNDFETDSTVFRTQLYELLKESNLNINFNQELYLDQLLTFAGMRKEAFQKKTKTGQLKLQNQAVMGIFPQSGSYLVPDYQHILENDVFDDLEGFFASKSTNDQKEKGMVRSSDRVIEENTYTPFRMDAYQEHAIQLVKKGSSLTVQGPPGSGKSQLITNLISDYVARGKNVLLVCQKKAALDVVYDRLKSKDLHDFVGMVHDFKNDRKDIFAKIENQIDRLDEYRQKNNGLDTIELERKFTRSSRLIEQITEELEEFREAVFDTKVCGKCPKELYLTSNPRSKSIPVKSVLAEMTYDKVPDFLRKVELYLEYYREYENRKHFWAHEHSFANFTNEDYGQIRKTLDDMFITFNEFTKASGELLHKELDYDATDFFIRNQATLKQFISNVDNETTYQFFKHLLTYPPDEKGAWIVDMERILLQCFKGVGPEISLKSENLGRFQESLETAIKARKNPLTYLRWRLFSKDRIFITRVLVANELKSTREGFQVLLNKIDNRLNYEHNVSLIEQKKWMIDFPATIRKIEVQNWFFHARLAFKTFNLFKDLRNLDAYISFKSENRKEQVRLLTAFDELVSVFPDHQHAWNQYLTNHQIRELLSDRASLDIVLSELDRDFENLRDFHQLKESLNHSQRTLIGELEELKGNVSERIAILTNSLALGWIDHLETKFPVLRNVSSMRFHRTIQDLKEAVDQKRSVSREILLLRSREKTLQNLEFNRLQNRLTYRDLHHQVTKKRQVWPLRRVLSNYKEEIFKLIPCWMASPESASAIFPMEELFDLVIFDEASQCFAERGIPAMYRGRQLVIAGDSKQLKPFDLYQVRWDENSEDIVDQELDALLDLSAKYLPEVYLQGHYRSNSMELIDFSNEHFYNNKLQIIPEYKKTSEKRAITVVRVNGQWLNNTNIKEAETVVKQVQQLHREDPQLSIGVVTFNSSQQSLIADLLDEHLPALASNLGALFVKNIENVQGDERDVIIFSTAYAKDDEGKLQLRFGPLNHIGGENRLNVAITRARKKIILVTSIKSSDLKTENTKNPGPGLLKAYLAYAEQVHSGNWIPQTRETPKNQPSWYLKNVIKDEFEIDQRYQLKVKLPFTDLTVTDQQENQYVGLIRTDDELYHDSYNVKDIYIYTPECLSDKGWLQYQVHSRQLWMNPAEVGDQLRLFIHRISADQSEAR